MTSGSSLVRRAVAARRALRDDAGFTLAEVLVSIVIVAGITGSLVAALVASLRATDSMAMRTKESNDAQFVASFLVRDAQAAGGVNPATAVADTNLGVSLTDPAGCTSGGQTLVARFRWADRQPPAANSSTPQVTTRVVSYLLDTTAGTLTRRACSTGPAATPVSSTVVARRVDTAVATCTPAAACPGMPLSVSLAITQRASAASTPFSFSLRADVRPDAQVAPSGGTSVTGALVVLGSTTCRSGAGTGVDVTGGGELEVEGGNAVIGAANVGACPAVRASSGEFEVDEGGTFSAVGTCSGDCETPPRIAIAGPIIDPLAGLPAPAGSCAGGSTGSLSGSTYSPGVYTSAVSVSGTRSFAAGTYVFCNGISIASGATVTSAGGGVLFYIPSGTLTINGNANVALSAPSSGPYRGLLVWQAVTATTTMVFAGNATANLNGFVYAPGADVSFSGGGDVNVAGLVARRVVISGGTDVAVTTLRIAPATPANGTVGVAYSGATFTAQNGVAPYGWSIAAGALPPGLTLGSSTTSSVTLTGTPTAPGAFTFTVQVTAPGGAIAQRQFSITINSAPIVISPSSLTNAVKGTAYAETLTATGGSGTYTGWIVTGGTLPAGLTLSSAGVLSGTPTAIGSFTFTAQVTDSLNATQSRSYSMTVAPHVVSVTMANGNTAGRADRGDTVTIQFSDPINSTSLCSSWTGANPADLTGSAVVVRIANSGSNDQLQVRFSGGGQPCGGNFVLGTLSLGADYVSSNTEFTGSGGNTSRVAFTTTTGGGASSRLVITLGSGTGNQQNVAAAAPTFVPNSAVTSSTATGGIPIATVAITGAATNRF